MIILTGTTGKIGGATLTALLEHTKVSPRSLAILTSSPDNPKFKSLRQLGIEVLFANYDNTDSLERALRKFEGATLFLVSTPAIDLDFNDAPFGLGRESHHFNVIEAAMASGIDHIYYTSLAFKDGSEAGVMRAHFRTEGRLKDLREQRGLKSTVVRVGLYNESWPLYLGHYSLREEFRQTIVVAGDGPISWTSIADLGLAIALLMTEEDRTWVGKTVYLSQGKAHDLQSICSMANDAKRIHIVSSDSYVEHYKTKGMGKPFLEWWVSTYTSLERGDACIQDPLLEELLSRRGKRPDQITATIEEMLRA